MIAEAPGLQLVKQQLKKSRSLVWLPSLLTGFSKQVIQSSVRGGYGYNPKSVDRK